MKDDILRLRSKGYTYNQIVQELGCSKGTVSYHCGEGQKEKTLGRTRKRRKSNPVAKKLDFYQRSKTRVDKKKAPTRSSTSRARDKSRDFQRRLGGSLINSTPSGGFSYRDVLEVFGGTPVCYLTGDPIDLTDPSSYQFDHIIPASRGGENTLENLGLTTREANISKSDMTVDEFVSLCRKVVNYYDNQK